ncbi:MAG: DUF5615 family PIN-like protein [Candidatus Micrarchaeota archaeon]
MKLFLDENLPRSLVLSLNELGFVVTHASDVGLRGAKDYEIAEYARKQNAILITKDLEFGSFLIYPKTSHHGLIILRFPDYFKSYDIARALTEFLKTFDHNNLIGKLIVLEIGHYRIREL